MKLGTSQTPHFSLRRRITFLGIAAIGAATIALASVLTAAPASISGIILLVGADESQRVVNWYASANTSQLVQLAPTSELLDGAFPGTATTFAPPSLPIRHQFPGFSSRAPPGLVRTRRSYRVGRAAWSPTNSGPAIAGT
jgi:hypothetical protein